MSAHSSTEVGPRANCAPRIPCPPRPSAGDSATPAGHDDAHETGHQLQNEAAHAHLTPRGGLESSSPTTMHAPAVTRMGRVHRGLMTGGPWDRRRTANRRGRCAWGLQDCEEARGELRAGAGGRPPDAQLFGHRSRGRYSRSQETRGTRSKNTPCHDCPPAAGSRGGRAPAASAPPGPERRCRLRRRGPSVRQVAQSTVSPPTAWAAREG